MLMMLPFEAPTIFEGIHKSYFRMPRVIKNQRDRFENDDLFRQLSHESAVKYTGFKDRPLEERQMKFITNCQEGHTEVSVVQSGSQFTLMFNPTINPAYNNEGCDFDKELGKVHIKAGFILNGVCVLWRGWIDLQRLEGFGCVEFDEYRAYLEDAMVKQSIDKQQTCNSLANNQTPIGRLNHHLGSASLLPPQSFNPATAAAAVAAITTNSIIPPPPLGLNPACLGGSGPTGLPVSHPAATTATNLGSSQGQPPAPASNLVNSGVVPPLPPPAPVSLANSVAHYENAALAAATAAAFHQLGLPGVPPSLTGHHHPALVPQHLPYSNGSNIIPSAAAATQRSNSSPLTGAGHQHHHHHHQQHNTSPQHNHHFLNDTQATTNGNPSALNSLTASMQHNNQARSPERENLHHHHNHNHHSHHHSHHQQQQQQQNHQALNTNSSGNNNGSSRRKASERAAEELTQTDEVDVVSDINVHELDFPRRKIFKSEPITTSHLSQKAARRAAS